MKIRTYYILMLTVVLALIGCREMTPFYTNIFKVDVFSQIYDTAKYDFLWVLDNSASMSDKRNYVKDHMAQFLNILNSRKAIDYQMAVVTTDNIGHGGQLVATGGGLKVVKSTAANPSQDFADVVNSVSDTFTSFWEQGLESSYKAVSQYGSEFMRTGVPLIIIYLTDEDDWSCQSSCTGIEPEHNPTWVEYPVSRYVDYFRDLKSSENSEVLIFPIVGLRSSSCSVPSYGDRYQIVSDSLRNDSAAGSICNAELSASYENVARVIADRGTRFQLTNSAATGGIRVYIDGTEVPFSNTNGYYFESSTNSILFTGNYIPANGATIEVTYSQKK